MSKRKSKGENASSNTSNNTVTRDVNAAQKARLALQLRAGGLPWDEVATQSGFASRGAAHNACMRELHRCVTHDVTEMRNEELYRIEQLQGRCYKAATDEKNTWWTYALDRWVILSERKAKLMGLDTPVETAQNANITVVREIPQGYLAIEALKA